MFPYLATRRRSLGSEIIHIFLYLIWILSARDNLTPIKSSQKQDGSKRNRLTRIGERLTANVLIYNIFSGNLGTSMERIRFIYPNVFKVKEIFDCVFDRRVCTVLQGKV